MKKLMIVLCMALAGCASNKPATQEVFIPVLKKCTGDAKKPVKPHLCVDTLSGDEKLDVILNCYQGDINELEIYSSKLESMICEN